MDFSQLERTRPTIICACLLLIRSSL